MTVACPQRAHNSYKRIAALRRLQKTKTLWTMAWRGQGRDWAWLDANKLRFSPRVARVLKKAVKESRDSFYGPWVEVVNYHPPTSDSSDEEVEFSEYIYPDGPPGSFTISGPLGDEGAGPGRRFRTIEDAAEWVLQKYGGFFRRVIEAEVGARWAFRVLPPVR